MGRSSSQLLLPVVLAATCCCTSSTAFLAPPAPTHPSRVALHATAGSEPPPRAGGGGLSRSQLLQRQATASTLLLGGAAVLLLGSSRAAEAAVPTMQEYYGGEGAQARTNNYIVSGKARKAQQVKDEAAEAGTQGAGKDAPLPSDPRVLLSEVDKALNALTPVIKDERWDDVLAATKKQPLSALLAPHLGYGSAAALGQAAGKTAAQAKVLEEARVEVGLTLQQLVDYAFSNRVIFFNALDKQQVAALAAQRATPPDLSEPLGLLADTQSLVKGLAGQL